jgi:transcriptional regulator with XRE-family HTH domain
MRSKTAIGEEIYRLRRELGWTQGELASKVGVSRAAISQFELGDTLPSAETQSKLSSILESDLNDIWEGSQGARHTENSYENISMFSIESYDYISTLAQKRDISSEPLLVLANKLVDVPVLKLPGVDYFDGYVIEIKGNNMRPRYPHGSRYFMTPAKFDSDDDIRFTRGVHFFILENREPFTRRVISTTDGVIVLQSDDGSEKMEFEIKDLKQRIASGTCLMYKLGQGVHMPTEE